MGYGTNIETLVSRLDHLDDLNMGRASVWTCTPTHAATRKLAWNIREALYIASLHEDKYPVLARAYRTFSIHIVGPGRVEARPKDQPIEVKSERLNPNPKPQPTPQHGVVGANAGFKTVAQVALSSAHECIQAWEAHLPSSDPLLLQRTKLPEDELEILYDFCQQNTPKLMILVGDDHITMSLYEAETATLAAWMPAAAQATPEEFDL